MGDIHWIAEGIGAVFHDSGKIELVKSVGFAETMDEATIRAKEMAAEEREQLHEDIAQV